MVSYQYTRRVDKNIYKSSNLSRAAFSFYTPPHISGGVLCFHVGRPCVCPSVRSTYVRPSALRFRSIT